MRGTWPLLALSPLLALLAMPLLLGTPDRPGGGLPSHPDIPDVALRAYVHGAALVGEEDPSCRPSWALLAGIGKVETDHGRFGGSALDARGVAVPPILGVVLDGSLPGTRPVHDTDGGRLDGDTTWDRAVGPMQFIPGTWVSVARDGDGDGTADPQDIDDAAATAAAHLCAAVADHDIAAEAGLRRAVRAYNHSDAYVEEVLGWMRTYLAEVTYPGGTTPGSGPITCPVLPPVQFIDSWHFPRSGGRVHLGQDMFAVEGQPLLAVDDGTVVEMRTGSGLGGTVIWLRTDGGHHWYYAHLSAFAPDLAPGDRVSRGQVVGAVGRTGNARTTPPHLHVQWRPDGRRGADVNPYPLLDAACRDRG